MLGVKNLALLVLFGMLFAIPELALAGKKALVIIDMQAVFATHRGYQTKGPNPEILKELQDKQIEMIAVAKKHRMPIMIVEYYHMGRTNTELLEAIGEYYPVVTVYKTTDGLFASKNSSAEVAKRKLAQWNVTDLIIMGANGAACVRATVAGALLAGYKVWLFKNGVADFNHPQFIFPYSYEKDEFAAAIQGGAKFVQYEAPRQFVNFRRRPRNLEKVDEAEQNAR